MMKRFLCILLLLVMVLLTACGGDGADKPRKTKFSDGGYMLTWSDENGKTTRMENYAKEGWFNTTEYEHDEDGNTTVMRDLDENDQELSRVQYYYKNGERVAEERYENNVLDRKYYYEGDKKVGQ
jgi:major membrane immunogen (membrane-anchored lipoprotein)